METTAVLVDEQGLRAVTMSEIAKRTRIGRATLYKYFPDVESILLAWHERQIDGHLAELAKARDSATSAKQQLEAVLLAFGHISQSAHGHSDAELSAFLHRDEQVAQGWRHLRQLIGDLIAEGALAGEIRSDISAEELSTYCLNALAGARELRSKAAVQRLVGVTLKGLEPLPD